jgi:hypothetical protein
MFIEQDVMPFYRVLLYTVNGITTYAYETMTSAEEQINIVGRKTGQSIKGEAINGHQNGSRERRTPIEGIPMGVLIFRHVQLN